jgi:hypothetical protein
MCGGSQAGGASGCRQWESGEQCIRAAGIRLQVQHVAGGRWKVGCGRRGAGGRCMRRLAAGSGVQCVGLWLVGVWLDVHRDLRVGGLVGGAYGHKWRELGGRCFTMRLAGVMREVLQDAGSWSLVNNASGGRGSGCRCVMRWGSGGRCMRRLAAESGVQCVGLGLAGSGVRCVGWRSSGRRCTGLWPPEGRRCFGLRAAGVVREVL